MVAGWSRSIIKYLGRMEPIYYWVWWCGRMEPIYAGIVITVPMMMLLADGLLLRYFLPIQATMFGAVSKAAEALLTYAFECTTVRQLITTYRKGAACAETFQLRHWRYNDDRFAAECHENRTLWLAKWVPNTMTFGLIGVFGTLVVQVETLVLPLSPLNELPCLLKHRPPSRQCQPLSIQLNPLLCLPCSTLLLFVLYPFVCVHLVLLAVSGQR